MSQPGSFLEESQLKALEFIYGYFNQAGRPPTQSEIGNALAISRSKVRAILEDLEQQGLLMMEEGVSRGLSLTKRGLNLVAPNRILQDETIITVPLAGDIVAGEPVQLGLEDFATYDEGDALNIPVNILEEGNVVFHRDFLPQEADRYFACRITKRIPQALLDAGDIVIAVRSSSCRDGDLVLAEIGEEGGAWIGHLYRRGDATRFDPVNPTSESLLVPSDAVRIQGKIENVIRLPQRQRPPKREKLRLDATVPETVYIGKSFSVVVAIRKLTSPIIVADSSKSASGEVQVEWPHKLTSVELCVEIDAPDCSFPSKRRCVVRLYQDSDSPELIFHLIPEVTGEINISVTVYQYKDEIVLGSTLATTKATQKKRIGQVELLTKSNTLESPDYYPQQVYLSSVILKNLRTAIRDCAPIHSHQALSDIFIDERIRPWKDLLPQTRTIQERVDSLISVLQDRFHHETKDNALVSFLRAVADRLHENDSCRNRLLQIADGLVRDVYQHYPT